MVQDSGMGGRYTHGICVGEDMHACALRVAVYVAKLAATCPSPSLTCNLSVSLTTSPLTCNLSFGLPDDEPFNVQLLS